MSIGVITAIDSRAVAADLLVCAECWAGFAWDSSPDLDRCQSCAEVHEWREGAINHAEHIDRSSRRFTGCDLMEA